jgi:hypothetical protein
VPIKVVLVASGCVVVEPLPSGVTIPISLLMLNDVAFSVVHESVVVASLKIVLGTAESVHAGSPGGGGGVTAIVASHVAVPPALVAVPV